jgi:hypothetical protein
MVAPGVGKPRVAYQPCTCPSVASLPRTTPLMRFRALPVWISAMGASARTMRIEPSVVAQNRMGTNPPSVNAWPQSMSL